MRVIALMVAALLVGACGLNTTISMLAGAPDEGETHGEP